MQEKDQSTISAAGRLELLRWLIDRSDRLRSSYSSRASLILSADALVVATLAFLLDKVRVNHPNRIYISGLIAVSLGAMLASFVLAFMASASFWRDTSHATKFHEKRYFFHATHTLNIAKGDFDSFKRDFKAVNIDELIDYACAQVWASYKLQRQRYRNLKRSILALLVAIITLIGALWIGFFT
jgi:hypothetical protein